MKPYYTSPDGAIVLYHGDMREIMPALAWDVLMWDPPYGVAFSSGRGGQSFGTSEIPGDLETEVRDFGLALRDDRPAAVFGSWKVTRPSGPILALLTWDKGEHVGMGDLSLPWKPNTEEIYIFGRGWSGRRRGSVLRHNAIAGTVATTQGRHHEMEKPVGLLRDLVAVAPPGTILDPTCGSGTTLVAAQRAGRKAIGIEIREEDCETVAARLGDLEAQRRVSARLRAAPVADAPGPLFAPR